VFFRAQELHYVRERQGFAVAHLFTILGPLLIAVGLVGSIRDLSGRNDRRF